jgi:C1A family cysteine protease
MFSKIVLALALFAAPASAKLYTSSIESQKYLWEEFKAEYGKTYSSPEEEEIRFNVFVDNLHLIDRRNEEDTAQHGITKFSDLTPNEFKTHFTNYVPNPDREIVMDETVEPLPEGTEALVDWTGVYTTPVKNQGYCGSCWAFSATEQIESDYYRTSGTEYILSPQQITSCDTTSYGCNGGWTENAYKYAEGGLELDSSYPYTSGTAGVTGTCKSSSSKYVVKTTGYTTVSSTAAGESKMASYVSSTGPLSVCVDAETWSSYTGGIMSVCGKSVDHCVQAVGINTSGGYWKVRNSWGTTWGESGFIRLSYGSNTCAIASDATWASVKSY